LSSIRSASRVVDVWALLSFGNSLQIGSGQTSKNQSFEGLKESEQEEKVKQCHTGS
jgi:hypothetical protein